MSSGFTSLQSRHSCLPTKRGILLFPSKVGRFRCVRLTKREQVLAGFLSLWPVIETERGFHMRRRDRYRARQPCEVYIRENRNHTQFLRERGRWARY